MKMNALEMSFFLFSICMVSRLCNEHDLIGSMMNVLVLSSQDGTDCLTGCAHFWLTLLSLNYNEPLCFCSRCWFLDHLLKKRSDP